MPPGKARFLNLAKYLLLYAYKRLHIVFATKDRKLQFLHKSQEALVADQF